MRAMIIDNGVALRRDYREPESIPGESIVRVRMAGICATDLELAKGYMNYRGVPGHEFVGEVLNTEDPTLRGRRVVGEINAGCGKCRACAEGLGRHCPSRTVLGILGRDGAFADYLRLPDRNLIPLPDSISDELAVFVEPLAAAYEIFEQTRIPKNHRVLILGDGRLGALIAMALKSAVTILSSVDIILIACGTLHCCRPREGFARSYDVVVDCTGAAQDSRARSSWCGREERSFSRVPPRPRRR